MVITVDGYSDKFDVFLNDIAQKIRAFPVDPGILELLKQSQFNSTPANANNTAIEHAVQGTVRLLHRYDHSYQLILSVIPTIEASDVQSLWDR